MIIPEFHDFIKRYTSYWSATFDEYRVKSWQEVLIGLNYNLLMRTTIALTKEEKFPPTIKVIIDKYEELKQLEYRADKESRIEQQQKYLATSTEGQAKCPICKNDGIVLYWQNDYQYMCRCSCARGKDLNKWSTYQITKDMLWTDPNRAGAKPVSIYVSNIDDIFTPEEIQLIKSKNSKEYNNPDNASIEAMIESIGK